MQIKRIHTSSTSSEFHQKSDSTACTETTIYRNELQLQQQRKLVANCIEDFRVTSLSAHRAFQTGTCVSRATAGDVSGNTCAQVPHAITTQ